MISGYSSVPRKEIGGQRKICRRLLFDSGTQGITFLEFRLEQSSCFRLNRYYTLVCYTRLFVTEFLDPSIEKVAVPGIAIWWLPEISASSSRPSWMAHFWLPCLILIRSPHIEVFGPDDGYIKFWSDADRFSAVARGKCVAITRSICLGERLRLWISLTWMS